MELVEKVELPNGLHVVIWGLRNKRDTFRYIHRSWFKMLKRSGIPVVWVDDELKNQSVVSDKSIVIAVNTAARHLPKVPGARYVAHNIDPEPYLESLINREHFLQIQVWAEPVSSFIGAREILPCVYLDEDNHVLYQPWGTPFAEYEWVRKPLKARRGDEFWIGSVWNNSSNQGNASMIPEWRDVLSSFGITLRKVPYGWPDNKIGYGGLVRRSSIAAAPVGDWQRENGYLPCRLFKNVSFGAVPVGNSPIYGRLFSDSAILGPSLKDTVIQYLELSITERHERVEFAQACMRQYTYEAAFKRILDQVL